MADLLRRVANLEADVKAMQANVSLIQRDLAVADKTLDHIVSVMATKSDMVNLEAALHKEISAQTWKILSWFVGVIGLVFAIARYVKP